MGYPLSGFLNAKTHPLIKPSQSFMMDDALFELLENEK
jgi:hypothetical protein